MVIKICYLFQSVWFIYFIGHEEDYKSISNERNELETKGSIKTTADSKPESKLEGETDVSDGSVENLIILIKIISRNYQFVIDVCIY